MKSLISNIIMLCLLICLGLTFSGCSADEDSSKTKKESNKEDVEKNEQSEDKKDAKVTAGTKEINVKLINSSGDEVNLWLGKDEKLSDENKLKGGGVRDVKSSMDVQPGDDGVLEVNGKINVGAGKDGKEVKTEELDISGEYANDKPILVYWQDDSLKATY